MVSLFLAAVAVVLLLRVRPVLIRAWLRLVQERSAAAFLGTAEDARGGPAAAWVLAAVVLATATGVLATVLLEAVGSAAARTSGAARGLDTSLLVSGVAALVVGGLVLAALLSATAVVITVIAAGPARRKRDALLRSIGLSDRERNAATVWELLPRCILGVIVGTAAGLVAAATVTPVIVPPGAAGAAPAAIALTAATFALATTAAAVVAVRSDRRRSGSAHDTAPP